MMKVWQPGSEEINKTKDWGIWTKEVSEFPWFYDDTETCLILEGEAAVTDNIGNSIHFKSGDMVQFQKGLSCKWKISKPIRKRYIFG
jgi:uncharacterized protein